MPAKPFDLPMQVAKQFVKDLRAFHAEPNAIKRNEIAAHQLNALRPYSSYRAKELRLADIKRMFEEMNDQA